MDLKILFIAALIFSAPILSQKIDGSFNKEQEEHVVALAIHNSIGWAKEKNLDLLYSVIAKDSNFIVVNPENRIIKGFQDFKRNEEFWMSPHFKAVRYEIKDLVINFSDAGDAAWFFCILDDINEWKGKPANWENTRWTGVLERRNDKWVIVQMHFSFANE